MEEAQGLDGVKKVRFWAGLPWDLISKAAEENKLDPLLVGAIVMTESAGDRVARRHEPKYRWLYIPAQMTDACYPNMDWLPYEHFGQKTSYGLLQIMGGVTRELGFRGDFYQLYDVETNLRYGCQHLRNFYLRYASIEDAVSSYNQGGPYKTEGGMYKNERYVDKVMRYYRALQEISNPLS